MRRGFYIILLVSLLACSQDPMEFTEQNPAIREALSRRRAAYAQEVMDNCRREAIKKADLYVDSLISAEIQIRVSDSILFPDKPLRPAYPGKIKFNDTLRVKPLK